MANPKVTRAEGLVTIEMPPMLANILVAVLAALILAVMTSAVTVWVKTYAYGQTLQDHSLQIQSTKVRLDGLPTQRVVDDAQRITDTQYQAIMQQFNLLQAHLDGRLTSLEQRLGRLEERR